MGLSLVYFCEWSEYCHSCQAQHLLSNNLGLFIVSMRYYQGMALLCTNPCQNAFGSSSPHLLTFSILQILWICYRSLHVRSEARQIAGAIRFATDGCRINRPSACYTPMLSSKRSITSPNRTLNPHHVCMKNCIFPSVLFILW